jgi:transposase
MRDIDLYKHLLGLESPWTVARVDLDVKGQRVGVFVEHAELKAWPCPVCDKPCALHDHEEERVWRHLDSCQFQTLLHARTPRIDCHEHGVRQVRVPWAEARSRFTLLFERLAIDVLRECDVKGAAAILRITWDEAHGIMQRAVARGLLRRPHAVPTVMGVDEKAIAKGHRYATLVNDLERGIVIEVAEDRTKQSLLQCLGCFSINDLSKVRAVAMDMWEPFVQTIRSVVDFADSKIVYDRYHIVAHMNDALDKVRRAENRTLLADGNEILVGSKHMWLYGAENLPDKYTVDFDRLRRSDLKTARAWAIKESLRALWERPSREAGEKWWKRWHFWATHSRLQPVRKVAAMIKRHLPNVLTYFEHRITNAASEAINSVVQMLKKRAFGYRNFANFRTAVLFRCGGLDLYPGAHPIPG